jgi:hypothetical protein
MFFFFFFYSFVNVFGYSPLLIFSPKNRFYFSELNKNSKNILIEKNQTLPNIQKPNIKKPILINDNMDDGEVPWDVNIL